VSLAPIIEPFTFRLQPSALELPATSHQKPDARNKKGHVPFEHSLFLNYAIGS